VDEAANILTGVGELDSVPSKAAVLGASEGIGVSSERWYL
jgi:hypothetical protein